MSCLDEDADSQEIFSLASFIAYASLAEVGVLCLNIYAWYIL